MSDYEYLFDKEDLWNQQAQDPCEEDINTWCSELIRYFEEEAGDTTSPFLLYDKQSDRVRPADAEYTSEACSMAEGEGRDWNHSLPRISGALPQDAYHSTSQADILASSGSSEVCERQCAAELSLLHEGRHTRGRPLDDRRMARGRRKCQRPRETQRLERSGLTRDCPRELIRHSPETARLCHPLPQESQRIRSLTPGGLYTYVADGNGAKSIYSFIN